MKRFVRRLICILCAAALVLSMSTALAAEKEYTYLQHIDNKETVSLQSYLGNSTHIVVPYYIDGYLVTGASGQTYDDKVQNTLQSIVWSPYIETISYFKDFTALQSVTLPEGVTRLGIDSFKNCVSLRDIVLPSTVKTIIGPAFQGCVSLTEFDLNCVEKIESKIFDGCTSLTKLDLGSCVKELPSYFIQNTAITELEFPDSLEKISSYAFSGSKLKRIELPDSVTSVAGTAVDGLENILEHITWTAGMTYIPGATFRDFVNLKTIKLPEGLLTVGKTDTDNSRSDAFRRCVSLTTVDFPDSLTDIGPYSFEGCTSLSSVSFGSGLTKIWFSAFANTALTSVQLPGGVTSIGVGAFPEGCVIECRSGSATEAAAVAAGYQTQAPSTVVVLPEQLETIEDEAFLNTNAGYVIVSEGVKTIGSKAFADMSNLRYVQLPESVESIADDAFAGCNIIEVVAPAGSYAEEYCAAQGIPVTNS